MAGSSTTTLSTLERRISVVRRSARPDFTMTRLLVTAISVTLRFTKPMQKTVAPTRKQIRTTQYMEPREDMALAPAGLENEATRNVIASSSNTAATARCPSITIQWSLV